MFFEYLKGSAPTDDLSKRIDESVSNAVFHDEWRTDYMTLLQRDKQNYNEGREEGEEVLSRLIVLLNENGRTEDVLKAATDKNYRKKLFLEFHLDESN